MLLPINKALAVCPICTLAVGAGVGIAEEFGVDDTIIGLWVGGLTVSLIFWTIDWARKKNYRSKWVDPIIIIVYFLMVVAPLFFIKIKGYPIIGKELNKFWGIDKMLLGIALGCILFFCGAKFYDFLKKKNGGHAHFPFQKVVMPVTPLIIFSVLFYLLNK
ncbi:MAG TPA: hypothetical protein VK255_04665 [Patescibacteria group bacterium]|nr:hypothetical protein [Patescibacteria group bacterium]